jgi:hypothetical protein
MIICGFARKQTTKDTKGQEGHEEGLPNQTFQPVFE